MHPILSFTRHYIEMILAMVVGMAGLGMLAGAVYDSDGPVLLGQMALAMTIPMVVWMRFRGHGWRATGEMAGSMLLATLATLALLGGGLVTDTDRLLVIEHAAMLPSMLVAMLLRRDEYSGRRHRHGPLNARPGRGRPIEAG
jgi:hypothetical protein